MDELKVIFEDIKYPRDSRGKKHNLLDIIIMSVCGILCGCLDFDDIEDYAIGTQHTIMDKIIESEGDFVLALKKNQKGAYSEVEEYFEQEDLLEDKVKVEKSKTTYDNSHGRIETRKCIVSTDVE